MSPGKKESSSTHHPRRARGTGRKDADGHDPVLKDPQGWDLSHPGSSRPDVHLQVLKTQPQQYGLCASLLVWHCSGECHYTSFLRTNGHHSSKAGEAGPSSQVARTRVFGSRADLTHAFQTQCCTQGQIAVLLSSSVSQPYI